MHGHKLIRCTFILYAICRPTYRLRSNIHSSIFSGSIFVQLYFIIILYYIILMNFGFLGWRCLCVCRFKYLYNHIHCNRWIRLPCKILHLARWTHSVDVFGMNNVGRAYATGPRIVAPSNTAVRSWLPSACWVCLPWSVMKLLLMLTTTTTTKMMRIMVKSHRTVEFACVCVNWWVRTTVQPKAR